MNRALQLAADVVIGALFWEQGFTRDGHRRHPYPRHRRLHAP